MGKAERESRVVPTRELQRRETLVLETLLSALDARESAKALQSPMLTYLTDVLIEQARAELADVRHARDLRAEPG